MLDIKETIGEWLKAKLLSDKNGFDLPSIFVIPFQNTSYPLQFPARLQRGVPYKN
jgi:hypothetical protein